MADDQDPKNLYERYFGHILILIAWICFLLYRIAIEVWGRGV